MNSFLQKLLKRGKIIFKQLLIIIFCFYFTNTYSTFVLAETTSLELLNVEIFQDEVAVGEEIKIEIKVNDPSTITTNPYHRFIELVNETTQQTVTWYLNKDSSGNFYTDRDIPGTMACGKWEIKYIYLKDILGNSKYFYKSDYSDLLSDSFTVSCNEGDRTPPELHSVSILQDEVQAGDILKVEATASDIDSGLKDQQYLYLVNKTYSKSISISLNYNNVTKKLEGEKIVPSSVNNGEWEISSISLYDNAGNSKDYKKSDYSNLLSDSFTINSVFSGIDNMVIQKGDNFNPLDTVKAYSNLEGDMTAKITVKGNVNTSEEGVYILKYEVIGKSEIDKYYDFRVIAVQNHDFTYPIKRTTPFYFNQDIQVSNPDWNPVIGADKLMIVKDGRELSPTVYEKLSSEGAYKIIYSGDSFYPYYAEFILDKTPPQITATYNKELVTESLDISVNTNDLNKVTTKWLPGEKKIEDFHNSGEEFSNIFSVNQNGKYTIYAKDEAGNESLQVIDVQNLSPNKIVSGWTEDSSNLIISNGNWKSFSNSYFSNGTIIYTGQKGAFAEVNFQGAGIRLYSLTSPYYGLADVYIDNEFIQEINLYSDKTKYKQLVFEYFKLEKGTHNIKFINKGAFGSPFGKGVNFNIDALDIIEETDTIPPESPKSLKGTISYSNVNLSWSPNLETDIKGYNIYRSSDGINYSKLNSSVVNISKYNDSTVENGKEYYYQITSIDNFDNESTRSLPYIATLPKPVINWTEDSSSMVMSTGSWRPFTNPYFSEGTILYSGQKGATIELAFNGTGIRLFSLTSPYYGLADVYIDNEKVKEINQFTDKTKYKQLVFEQLNLKEGDHIIKIINKGVMGSLSGKGVNINIDAFDVLK